MASIDLLVDIDVSDPTDFPSGNIAPGLRELDDSLRCGICRELYEAPVTLACGHSFCSMCIRTNLALKGECPACRQTASESHIRKNTAIESALKAWRVARPYVLELCRTDHNSDQSATPLDFALPNNSERPSKKRKRRSSKEESSDSDIEILSMPPKQCTSGFKPRGTGSSPPSADPRSSPVGLVECPICQKPVAESFINEHIDSGCQRLQAEKGMQKQAWSKLMGTPGASGSRPTRKGKGKAKERARSEPDDTDGPQYIPKVAYDTLKDKIIKERLQEHGLPTTGDRSTWIERHKHWIALFNANRDHSPASRKGAEQLRRELARWEDEQKKVKQAVPDTNAYQKANKAAFSRLVDAARPKKIVANGVSAESREKSPSLSLGGSTTPVSMTDTPDDDEVVDLASESVEQGYSSS